MELRDTVEMMNSEDYKERFKAEYLTGSDPVQEGFAKCLMIGILEELRFAPKCPRSIYRLQTKAMLDYIAVS